MSTSTPDYFTSDPDWEAYATRTGFPLPSDSIGQPSSAPIEPLNFDIAAARDNQAEAGAEWAATHPLSAVRYVVHQHTIQVRDGSSISVRITHTSPSHLLEKNITGALPILFVTHGGSWLQRTDLSEEAWLFWPLYEHFKLVTISVKYRLAPEYKFPVWIEDSWDILSAVLSPDTFILSELDVEIDRDKMFLAGSSSGACISAVLSQMCRDRGIHIAGVILNVPVVCDYRHFPSKYHNKNPNQISSYHQAVETFSSGAMVMVWNTIQPSASTGFHPRISPLLGDLRGLPRHMVFLAGQDALRDEGIAYVEELREAGVEVQLSVFKGVPHHFAQIEELGATRRFREVLMEGLGRWLGGE